MSHENDLFNAAINGEIKDIKKCLLRGANIFTTDGNGTTLLMFATRHGHLPLVEWLVTDQKLNIKQKNHNGSSALLSAIKGGHMPVVQWLVEHGANVYEAYPDGTSAMELAKNLGHQAILQYLKLAQEKIERDDMQNAKHLYEEQQYDKAVPLFYSLVQRNINEAKHILDNMLKNPNLAECQTLIAFFNQELKKAPENRNYQFYLAELFTALAQLTPSYELAKVACHCAKDFYVQILKNNPADNKAEEGLTKIKQVKDHIKHREQEKKINQQKQQITHDVNELAQLVASNTLDPSALEQRFKILEQQALDITPIEFYVTRGNFHVELASEETSPVQKDIFFNKAIADYHQALEIDPLRNDLAKRIEEIESLQRRRPSPLPHGDPRLFRSTTKSPSPARRASTQQSSPAPRRISPHQLAELGKRRHYLGPQ